MTPNRPLTHDLFKNTLDSFEIELKEVIINNLLDGIFYAQLVCVQNDNVMQVDARTSDAISLAVRYGCPIYTFDFIMDSAGVELDEEEAKDSLKYYVSNQNPVGLLCYKNSEAIAWCSIAPREMVYKSH